MYAIVVTHGTKRMQPYATGVKSRRDAEALVEVACRYGYTDATIWNEKDFWKACRSDRTSEADQAGSA